MNKTLILDKLNKYLLYLVVFLIPLFFLPFTQNVLSYPKRFLLLILVVLSLTVWLIKQKVQGLTLKQIDKKMYWVGGLILASFTLSTIFSLGKGLSFWGRPYSVSDSLLSIIILLGLAFLILNSFSREEYLKLVYLLIGSGALVGLFAILKLYGISLVNSSILSGVGSFNTAAIFSAVLFPLALAVLVQAKNPLKILLGISAAILLATVLLINFKPAWIVLLIGVLFSLFFSTWNPSSKLKLGWIAGLMIGLILALFFIIFRFPIPGFPTRSPEVSLNLNSEYNILKGVFAQGLTNKILGTGPSTFKFDYSQFRSPALNQTIFWGTRFTQGNCSFWDWIITKGILGGLALVLLWVLLIIIGIKKIIVSDSSQWEIKLGVMSSLVGLIGAHFLHPFNFSLYFIFWVTVGIFLGLIFSEIKKVKLGWFRVRFGFSLVLVLVVLLGIGLILVQGIRYFSEVEYYQGIQAWSQGNIESAISHLSRATQLSFAPLSSPRDRYYRDLAQLYLARANQITANKNLKNPGLVQTSVVKGIRALNKATKLAPFNPANWNVRGFFYRNLIGVKGAGKSALESYRKATELEPSSPFAYAELGRVHILMAQQGTVNKSKALEAATKALNKAIELKSDYAPAHYLLAVVYDQQGKLSPAITKLKKAQAIAPRDVGLAFQLGVLYWRQRKFELARAQFEKAVKLNPNYSNARYMLGLVYDRQGNREQAKRQFQKVAQLNPNNQRVKKILENLNQGLPALKNLGSKRNPLQKTPQEIQD